LGMHCSFILIFPSLSQKKESDIFSMAKCTNPRANYTSKM
jgi:hypothetical protein